MAEIRPCAFGWAYCDGNCSICQKAVTTATTTTGIMPDFLTGMFQHFVTNADRIRAKSDEELARFLYYKIFEFKYKENYTVEEWLTWLQSPADGGDGDA